MFLMLYRLSSCKDLIAIHVGARFTNAVVKTVSLPKRVQTEAKWT